MPKKLDLTGLKFGRLTVLREAAKDERTNNDRAVHWVCKCDCGNTHITSSHSLRNGDCKSCGCLHKELLSDLRRIHGESKGVRLYKIWQAMKRRCHSKNDSAYKYYGGRGVSICTEWRDSYEAFRDWAFANGYADDLTIDRIDSDGNYEPMNCRWATRLEQSINTRKRFSKYTSSRTGITALAREHGIKKNTVFERLRRGWTLEEALNTPVK